MAGVLPRLCLHAGRTACAIAMLMATHAAAQTRLSQSGDSKLAPEAILERSDGVIRGLQSLGPWAKQAELIQSMSRNVFDEYSWDAEEDHFAEQLVDRVVQIPPWQVMDRFHLAMDIIAERYELDEKQKARIGQRALWRSAHFAVNHAPAMLQLAEQILGARLEGRPFTQEEVARWSQLMEPLLREGQTEFARFCRDVEPLLEERQRELLARDHAADDRRTEQILAKLNDWKRGQWRPEDWGLQDDPLHRGWSPQIQSEVDSMPNERGRPRIDETQCAPTNEDAWGLYVRRFIRVYRLDQEQQNLAWAVLHDVRSRAAAHRAAAEQERGGLSHNARLDRLYENLFVELKDRLSRILTPRQIKLAQSLNVQRAVPDARPAAPGSSGSSDAHR
jgi:hypothetical protein